MLTKTSTTFLIHTAFILPSLNGCHYSLRHAAQTTRNCYSSSFLLEINSNQTCFLFMCYTSNINEVLAAANFEGYDFKPSIAHEMAEKGFVVGAKVKLVKRVTHEFGKKKFRKDIAAGTITFIKGSVDDRVVVRLEAEVGKKVEQADVAVKMSNICLYVKGDSDDEDPSVGGGSADNRKVLKAHPFLKDGDDDTLDVIKGWERFLMDNDQYSILSKVQAKIAFAIENLNATFGKLTEKDLLIVTRNGSYELWSKRDFAPRTLVLVPDSTEIKPRFWTANRGAVCKGSDKLLKEAKDRRPLVIDGRVRAVPEEGKAFAPFWLVQRKDGVKANMSIEYVALKGCMTMAFETPKVADRKMEWADGDLPSVPVLINLKKIGEHSVSR